MYGIDLRIDYGFSSWVLEVASGSINLDFDSMSGEAKPTPLPKLEVKVHMRITMHDDPSVKMLVTDEMEAMKQQKIDDMLSDPGVEPTVDNGTKP